jgi:hypothetical protein
MSLDKSRLTEFLEEIDKELDSKITLVAAGGTAMTLLDVKTSTIDVDFTGPADSISELNSALERLQPGFRVDRWPDGMVFSQTLPGDYLHKSIPIKTALKHIELRAMHPLDIVVTKIGRLDGRDWEDIENCIRRFGLTRTQVKGRAAQVEYVGNDEVYRSNVESVLDRFFPKKQ